jgi:hypothetical protein
MRLDGSLKEAGARETRGGPVARLAMRSRRGERGKPEVGGGADRRAQGGGERERGRGGGTGTGWAERRGERGLGVLESFLFFKLLELSSFSNFKFKLFLKHFNPFQIFQNILKTFKTSHKQIKPCIPIMMHKLLLLLIY